jgi:hypothetical protein
MRKNLCLSKTTEFQKVFFTGGHEIEAFLALHNCSLLSTTHRAKSMGQRCWLDFLEENCSAEEGDILSAEYDNFERLGSWVAEAQSRSTTTYLEGYDDQIYWPRKEPPPQFSAYPWRNMDFNDDQAFTRIETPRRLKMVSSYEVMPPICITSSDRCSSGHSPSSKKSKDNKRTRDSSLDYELQLWKRREGFFRVHSMSQEDIEKTRRGCCKGMSQPENEIQKPRKLGSLRPTQTNKWQRRDSVESELEGGEQTLQWFDQLSMCLVAAFQIAIIMTFGHGCGVLDVAVLCLPFFLLVTVLCLRPGVLVLPSKNTAAIAETSLL